MMSAEESVDLNDELSLLNLKEPKFPIALMTAGPSSSQSSRHSSMSPSIVSESDENSLQKSMKEESKTGIKPVLPSKSADLHTPAKFTPAATPQSDVSTSSLFQNDATATDFLAAQPLVGSTNFSKNLFPATNDAFLTNSNIQQSFLAPSIAGQSAPPQSNTVEKKYPSIQQTYQKDNSLALNPISTTKPTPKLYEQTTNYTLQSKINSGVEAPNFASNGALPPPLAKQQQDFSQGNRSVQNGTAMGHNVPSVSNYHSVSTFIPSKLQSNNTSDTFTPLKHPLQTVPVSNILNPSVNINNIPNKSNTSSNPVLNVSNNPSSKSHQSPYQATNIFQASGRSTEQTNSQLFIPNMYSTSSSNSNNSDMKQTFFTPSTPAADPLPEQLYRPQGNGSITTPGVAECAHQENSYQQDQSYRYNQPTNFDNPSQQAGGSFQLVTGKDGKGIWQWIKNAVNKDWSQVEDIKRQIKHAADSVLTTLDPGMEEYLKPVVNIGVSSQNVSILMGIRQGFTNTNGVAVVKGQHLSQQSAPMLPVGLDAVLKSVNTSLDYLTNVNFEFPGAYLVVTVQPFIIELLQGRWSVMVCVALKDMQRDLVLHGFSQPISLPTECVTYAYNRTVQNVDVEFLGYDIPIEEAVKMHIPFTKEQDWCSVLSGISLQQLISSTAQALSSDYKRQTESSAQLNYAENVHTDYSNTYSYGSQHQNQQKPENFSVSFNGF